MNEMPVEADPENGVAPLLGGGDEAQQGDDDVELEGHVSNADSPQIPGFRIVMDPNSDLELLGVGW
eukprot:CAMPEP_0117000014 /NCGR_PEP_ID=MMETSP0472-20121206/2509_1 /TAXON_ID=693140 ORGANISM="Tiarina fusus, Strain LIS" /NCGR_SAMPLE_ID=MMETSP0472 /ASSEMBLY_ACC=CAM_ASM_000603 /LENGTH=65 /DNA_ID=CAMNT_0004699589 /DNA_START=37 /DNA_END=231 /DNA_ORIENTATION=+